MGKYVFRTKLTKNNVRKHMYAGRFKNKNLFWEHVEQVREERRKQKKGMEKPIKNLGERYKHLIPKENFKKIKAALLGVNGSPSFYDVYYEAGESKNSYYDGWTYGNEYSRGCGYRSRHHAFVIKAPRKLRIDVVSFDGLYNVQCKKIKETKDITIYKADWIQTKRGFEFEIISGCVATNKYGCYHANSVKQALKGLRRKTKREINKMITPESEINLKKFMTITGACETGCRDFLGRHDINANSMKAKELIAVLKEKHMSLYAEKLEKAIK